MSYLNVDVREQDGIPNTTGREWLIRSHLSASFCFKLSGNSN